MRDADLLLRERARHASPTVDVPLPSHLSVSALVTLRRDPAELARRLRRPMPAAPAPQARRGTAFHAWLEERFGAAKLVDLDELPGVRRRVRRPRQRAGRAAGGVPRQRVGRPAAGRGRGALRDAARAAHAARPDRRRLRRRRRAATRSSTGRPARRRPAPSSPPRRVQLAAYRLGWSRLTGVPVERVSAGFHHVAAGVTLRPVDLLDEAGLLALVTGTPTTSEPRSSPSWCTRVPSRRPQSPFSACPCRASLPAVDRGGPLRPTGTTMLNDSRCRGQHPGERPRTARGTSTPTSSA